MNVLYVWPLIFTIFVPAIIILYLLKQKAKPYLFSSIYLWKSAYQNIEASTPWEKLKKNLLMLLQILLVLLFIFTLMSPYLTKGGHSYQKVVLVLDKSGSMNSRYTKAGEREEKTRFEEAKEQAVHYVDSLSDQSEITLVSGGQKTTIELSNSTDKKETKKTIMELSAEDTKGDLNNTISFIESMTSDWANYQAIFFTDSSLNLGKVNGEVINLNQKDKNAAIDYVSHKENEDGTLTVLVKVSNYGVGTIATDLNLYLDNKIEQIKEVKLSSGESDILYFSDFPKKGSYIKAELNEPDGLECDNIGYDVIKEKRQKKVLLVSKQNVFLEKAIQTVPNISLYKTNRIENLDDKEEYDVYIFDGMVPNILPKRGSIILIHPNKSVEGIVTVGMTRDGGYVKAEEKSIVTEGLSGYEFGVNKIQEIKDTEWGTPFLTLGDCAIGVMGEQAGRKTAVLGFDIHESDLPLQPEFPILIYHLMNQCLDTDLVGTQIVTAGEKVELFNPQNGSTLFVKKEDKKADSAAVELTGTKITYDKTDQTGIYRVSCKNETEIFAVNFPVEESKTFLNEATVTGQRSSKNQDEMVIIQGGVDLRIPLIILIFFLLVIEEIIYYRQGTFPKKDKVRRNLIIGLRFGIIACLIFAMINPSIKIKQDELETVFLVDVSDSVSGQKKLEEEFVQETIMQLPKKEKAAVVAFGADNKVEQFMSDKRLFSELETMPISTATNLEQAIQGALTLFSSDTGKRIVLLTDGNENAGSLEAMSQALKKENVKVVVKQLDSWNGDEVYVDSMSIPEKINVGDMFQVKVNIQSNVKTSATLSLYSGSVLKKREEISLETGTNRFIFKDIQRDEGIKSYRAVVEAKKDTIQVNNEYAAFTKASKSSTVLLIEGRKNSALEFEKLCRTANVNIVRVMPNSAPRTMSEFMAYKSIVLLDVHGEDLPEEFMNNIEGYVKDYAGGVVAIGGENSFALGNWRDTPLETVLPVQMDLQGEKEIPKTAIALVIDRSGSMADGNGSITQLDLAKQAAAAAANTVRSTDEIGVLAFESSFEWVVPMTKAAKKETIEDGIYSIELGGGTSIYPAVKDAYKKLTNTNAKIKHIILLTDGQDGFDDYSDLLKQLNRSGVTLSTVAVGNGADKTLLGWLAKQGKGRAYYTDIHSDIPRIFAKEVFLSASSYLVQEEFTPIITSNSEMLSSLVEDGLPTMKGYIASSPKDSATVHLMSDRGDPILTSWQCGLGRTVAFNSDGENKWTGNYAKWDKYPMFWKNIIEWTITDMNNGDNSVKILESGQKNLIQYETKQYDKDTKVTAVCTDEKGETKEVLLEAMEPGTYIGKIQLPDIGVYSINVTKKQNGKIVSTENTAMAVQYSNEYRVGDTKNVLKKWVNEVDGIFVKQPHEVQKTKIESVASNLALSKYLLVLSLLFFMAEIVCKRLAFERKKKIRKPKEAKDRNEVRKEAVEPLPPRKKNTESKQKKKENVNSKKSKDSIEKLDTDFLLKRKKQR